ncbi:MAG: hypothetical protein GY749_20975 [Desulfobacteraceae bacterium]|nr:hypothetical protein [Desulfobacteraceae bacterium]
MNVFICLLIILVLFFAGSLPVLAEIPATERQALNSTNGSGWTNNTNWLGEYPTGCIYFRLRFLVQHLQGLCAEGV